MSHDALPIAWHVTMRLRVDRLIARMACEYRLASRIILKLGGRCGLLAHRVVDTHIHALVGPSREQAGRFALHVESSLQQSLGFGQPFEPARFTPIVDLLRIPPIVIVSIAGS